MRQAQKKKENNKTAIVLVLCFLVMALTSIFAVKATIDKVNNNAPELPVSEETKTSDESNSNPKDFSSQTDESKLSVDTSSKVPAIDSLNPKESSHSFISPLANKNAKITNPYSMDKLIYSVTLDQYMTHQGIDIEAPEDSQVLAIHEGTVTAIYNDDRYGTSIEITHPNKIISIYSNLSSADMVEVGDVVTKGQIIGGVGSTGLFEALEPSHLHFELIKEGLYVNPADYISF